MSDACLDCIKTRWTWHLSASLTSAISGRLTDYWSSPRRFEHPKEFCGVAAGWDADEAAVERVRFLSDRGKAKVAELDRRKPLGWAVAVKQSKRKIVVLTSFVALLSLTSALLLALAPPPLVAEGFNSLSAADRPEFLEGIFKTTVPAKANQWKYIYIHHSNTRSGDASTLAAPGSGMCDHFLIGNGSGCQDGEIQVGPRWMQQQPPAAPPGVEEIEPDCISICVVGDFDTTMPTPTQLHRLSQLVGTLQTQFRLGADKVILLNQPGSPSSVGRYFPVTAFRDQILP